MGIHILVRRHLYTETALVLLSEYSTLPGAMDTGFIPRWGSLLVKMLGQYQFEKSQNAPVPYPTMLHSEQKCAHICFEWSLVGYGAGAFWDLWIRSIVFSGFKYTYQRYLSNMLSTAALTTSSDKLTYKLRSIHHNYDQGIKYSTSRFLYR